MIDKINEIQKSFLLLLSIYFYSKSIECRDIDESRSKTASAKAAREFSS